MTRNEILFNYRHQSEPDLLSLRNGVMRCLVEGCQQLPPSDLQMRLSVIEEIRKEQK